MENEKGRDKLPWADTYPQCPSRSWCTPLCRPGRPRPYCAATWTATGRTTGSRSPLQRTPQPCSGEQMRGTGQSKNARNHAAGGEMKHAKHLWRPDMQTERRGEKRTSRFPARQKTRVRAALMRVWTTSAGYWIKTKAILPVQHLLCFSYIFQKSQSLPLRNLQP